jgi:hypothetical protein
MDVPLDTIADETPETPVAKKQKSKGKLRDDDGPVKEVIEFLTTWQSAKIVVVIETHCLETGVLVWRGDEPANYETCSLNEVSICDLCVHRVANACCRSYRAASPPRSSSTCRIEKGL